MICEFAASPPQDGWVYEDDFWVSGILEGLEVPGWLVLGLRRHVIEIEQLTDEELASLGVVVGELSRAIRIASDAERIYMLVYGENAPHFHVLLAARTQEIPAEHRHAAFWEHRGEYVNPRAAESVSERVRASMSRRPEGPSNDSAGALVS
jgi:diadenosine tetraphosphate (Ap4A) HIT family hydrolase